MRRAIRLLVLPLAILAGCEKSEVKEGGESKPPPQNFSTETDTNGQTVVSVNGETQKRIGLEVAAVAAAEWPAQTSAYGSVLDPAPLIAQHGEMAADEAALAAAQKIAQRERALFAEQENVSRKSLEAAEADETNARIKLDTARQSLQLAWGDAVGKLSDQERGQLVDGLASRRVALARVDLMAGEVISNLPPEASLSPAGQNRWVAAKTVGFAGTVDPHTLGQGILLRVEAPDALLGPGAAVEARLSVPGPAQQGGILPESAVVRFDGRPWIYEQEDDTNFIRREVSLDRLLPKGWFTTNGPAPGEKIVTVGAAILLSEEQKSQSSGGAD